jgi:hypothetical protein
LNAALQFGDLPGHEFHGNQWTGGTGSQAFKDWFGKSKVVDSKGQPRVVYHGTNDNISEFEHGVGNKKDNGWLGEGFYFSSHTSIAGAYVSLKGGHSPNMMPVYLKIEHPFYATEKDKLMNASQSEARQLTEKFRSRGYDGAILTMPGGYKEYVVFKGTQIKSAIGNRGTYDPKNPDITMAAKFGAENMLLKDAEIFQAGSWPGQGAKGITFTEEDLDGIVSSFSALGLTGRIPIKVGHQGKDVRSDDTAPSLGWVQAVRRAGSKLLADIQFTSDKLVAGIKAGQYKFVSAELLHNVKAHTRLIPWVLDAVALLGASAPAVGTLRDLQTSMQSFSRRTGLRFSGERLAFRREDANQSATGVNDMDEAAVQAAIAKAVSDASEKVTAKFTSEVGELKTQLTKAQDETKKAQAQAHRFSVMAPFELAIKNGVINAAAKDQFVKMNCIDDDVKVMSFSAKIAEDFIEGYKDIPKFKGPGAAKRVSMGVANDPEALIGKTTAQAVTFHCEERIIKTGGKLDNFEDWERANRYVLGANKDLALQYFADPQALYEPPGEKSDAA